MTLCCCCHGGDSNYEEMQEPGKVTVSSELREQTPVKQPICVGDTAESTLSLKRMLGHRRLSHMPWASDDSSDAGATAGPGPRLRFALRYECASEQLKLWLLQGREIQVDTEPGLPLVHIALLPGKRGTVQCKIPKKTAKPVFGERFIFQVTPVELPEQTLQLSVYSVDPKGKHQLVGHVVFPLKGLQLEEGVKCDVWRSLKDKPFEASPERGSVCLSLGYNASLARITVFLLRAKDLPLQGDAINTGVYCKLWLYNHNQLIKCKKTATVNGTDCPEFNKSFKFQVLPTNLDRVNLCISVHFDEEEKGERPLGRVLLGPFMYSRGQQLDHWNAMLNNPKDMVKYWHMVGPPK